MSTWKGKKIEVTLFGASHAEKIGATCKNFPKEGFDFSVLKDFLNRRKPTYSPAFTERREPDNVVFDDGIDNNTIVKDTFTATIFNVDVNGKDYDYLYGKPRPSHADLSAYFKDGRLDFSGGGEFSGRMTAPLSVAGGIAKQMLFSRGVKVYAYLSRVGNVTGKSYKTDDVTPYLPVNGFPSIGANDSMIAEIENAKSKGDSVGATVECVVFGFPKGLGGELFDGLEGKIASILYAIPGVKGVEFGLGFDFSCKSGSKTNDPITFDGEKIVTKTNNCGGINGGISNGMPICISVSFKPTPSIKTEQETVDLVSNNNVKISVQGRHDACIGVRAVPVVEAAISLALLDEVI